MSLEEVQEVQKRIRHAVLEFQIGDLRKATCNGLNFLVAIGLMVSTEFLGGLLTGELGNKGKGKDKSKERFEAGFKYLGERYEELLNKNRSGVCNIYRNVRCGLVHQYIPPMVRGIYTRAPKGCPGILEKSGQLLIAVENYLCDLEDAVNRLLESLPNNSELLEKCKKALGQIPKLD